MIFYLNSGGSREFWKISGNLVVGFFGIGFLREGGYVGCFICKLLVVVVVVN